MIIINKAILNEKKRNENMIKVYKEKLEKLPKGTIIKKNINNKEYYYLYYRQETKVISKYLGSNIDLIMDIEDKINRRKQIENILKKLYYEKNKLSKMEELL